MSDQKYHYSAKLESGKLSDSLQVYLIDELKEIERI